MNTVPIAPYAHRAPVSPNLLTRNLVLSVVKNHSQLSSDASRAMVPVSRNIAWTTVCSIMRQSFLRCPTLCLELNLGSVTGDEGKPHLFLYDVPDDSDVLHGSNLFMVCNGDSEQQLIVFTTV